MQVQYCWINGAIHLAIGNYMLLFYAQLYCGCLILTNVNVSAPPSVPTITSLTKIYSDQLTVTWTSVPMATSYNVSINGSTPISLPANANTYTFTGLTNNTV